MDKKIKHWKSGEEKQWKKESKEDKKETNERKGGRSKRENQVQINERKE